MTKAEKLREKLELSTITASELRSLLKKEAAVLDRTKGSHEVWKLRDKRMVLATHSKELKPYQIKQAKEFLYGTEEKEST